MFLVNCAVATEGFDEPTIEVVRALARKGCGGAVIYAAGFAATTGAPGRGFAGPLPPAASAAASSNVVFPLGNLK